MPGRSADPSRRPHAAGAPTAQLRAPATMRAPVPPSVPVPVRTPLLVAMLALVLMPPLPGPSMAAAAAGSAASGGTASGGTASGGTAPGGTAPGGTASGGTTPADAASGATAAGPATPVAAAPSLPDLLRRIALHEPTRTQFVERKLLKVLDEPVESSGELRYAPPARLEKRTEAPIREALVLDGDRITLERDGRRRTMSMAQLPGVSALVGGLRDVLSGNEAGLRQAFRVVTAGSDASWQISLLPSTQDGAQLVSRVDVRGSAGRVTEIETLQADGDRSVMTLTPARR